MEETNKSKIKYDLHRALVDKLHEVYIQKNECYGDSFGKSIDTFGIVAASVRMWDKLNRFVNLTSTGMSGGDESIDDTLLDLANYAIMTYIERRMRFVQSENIPSGSLIRSFLDAGGISGTDAMVNQLDIQGVGKCRE